MESCFEDGDDALIEQALATEHPWLAGVTRERLEREGQVALQLPVNAAGEALPFSTAGLVSDGEWTWRVDACASVQGSGGVARLVRRRRVGLIRWSFCRVRRTTI